MKLYFGSRLKEILLLKMNNEIIEKKDSGLSGSFYFEENASNCPKLTYFRLI